MIAIAETTFPPVVFVTLSSRFPGVVPSPFTSTKLLMIVIAFLSLRSIDISRRIVVLINELLDLFTLS